MHLLWLKAKWYRLKQLVRWYKAGYRFIRNEYGTWECYSICLRDTIFGLGETKDLAKADLHDVIDKTKRTLFGVSRSFH